MMMGEHEVFISSTFFPNSLSYIAALKTIEIMERDGVLEEIWAKGREYMDSVQKVFTEGGFDKDLLVKISGIPPMSFITFGKDPEKKYKLRRTLFYSMLIRQGIFQQPYHHGYICYRHTREDLTRTAEAIGNALAIVREEIG
jgi:glutamate-1-semialdehyde aminotransferase